MGKYYHNRYDYFRIKKRFFWERATKMPLFLVNRAFYIHKGLYFRKKRIEYYHMGVPIGSFSLTRKPFTPPIRVKKGPKKKKKRYGKIQYE